MQPKAPVIPIRTTRPPAGQGSEWPAQHRVDTARGGEQGVLELLAERAKGPFTRLKRAYERGCRAGTPSLRPWPASPRAARERHQSSSEGRGGPRPAEWALGPHPRPSSSRGHQSRLPPTRQARSPARSPRRWRGRPQRSSSNSSRLSFRTSPYVPPISTRRCHRFCRSACFSQRCERRRASDRVCDLHHKTTRRSGTNTRDRVRDRHGPIPVPTLRTSSTSIPMGLCEQTSAQAREGCRSSDCISARKDEMKEMSRLLG